MPLSKSTVAPGATAAAAASGIGEGADGGGAGGGGGTRINVSPELILKFDRLTPSSEHSVASAYLRPGYRFQKYKGHDVVVIPCPSISMASVKAPSNTAMHQLLALAKHANLLAVRGVVESPDGSCALVLRYTPLTLLRAKLHAGEPWPYNEVLRYCVQFAAALAFLHDQTPARHHGALSLDTIYEDGNGNVVLADFFLLEQVLGPSSDSLNPAYMSLSALKMQPRTQAELAADDMYALGMVMFAMCSGEVPWPGMRRQEIEDAMTNGEFFEFPEDMPEEFEPLCVLIAQCLQQDPWQRPTANHMLRKLTELCAQPTGEHQHFNTSIAMPPPHGYRHPDDNVMSPTAGLFDSIKQRLMDGFNATARTALRLHGTEASANHDDLNKSFTQVQIANSRDVSMTTPATPTTTTAATTTTMCFPEREFSSDSTDASFCHVSIDHVDLSIVYGSEAPAPRRVLLSGPSGSGKTVLMHKLCQLWSCGALPDFSHVFHVDLCNFSDAIATLPLPEVLCRTLVSTEQRIVDEMTQLLRENGDNVLIILDGLEKYMYEFTPLSPAATPRSLMALINGKCRDFAQCHLLLTVSLDALDQLQHGIVSKMCEPFQMELSVYGFAPEAQQAFVKQFLGNCDLPPEAKLADRVLCHAISENQPLQMILRSPMLLRSVCQRWAETVQPDAATATAGEITATDMFDMMVRMLMHHALAKPNPPTMEACEAAVRALGKLAWDQLQHEKLYIPDNDVQAVLRRHPCALQLQLLDRASSNLWQFRHTHFQSFLAAQHLYEEKVFASLFRGALTFSTKPIYDQVWRFTSGMLGPNATGLLKRIVDKANDERGLGLLAMQCARETGVDGMYSVALRGFRNWTLSVANFDLTPHDVDDLVHFLMHFSDQIRVLDLSGNRMLSIAQADRLIEHIQAGEHIVELRLRQLPMEVVAHFASHEPIRKKKLVFDDDVLALKRKLKLPDATHMWELADVKTDGDVQRLAPLAACATSLTTIVLTSARIKPRGALVLATGLQNHPSLKELHLSDWKLDFKLKEWSMTDLKLKGNNIGVFTSFLGIAKQLESLVLDGSALLEDELRDLIRELPNLPLLRQLSLRRMHISERNAAELATALKDRHNVTLIFSRFELKMAESTWALSEKQLNDEDAIIIAAFIPHATRLQRLELQGNVIGDTGAHALSAGLRCRPCGNPACPTPLQKLSMSRSHLSVITARSMTEEFSFLDLTEKSKVIGKRKPVHCWFAIDVGTTKIRVSCYRDGEVHHVELGGTLAVPSKLTYDGHTLRLAGAPTAHGGAAATASAAAAAAAAKSSQEATIFHLLRLLGRQVDDEVIQRNLPHWPFTVCKKDGELAVEVEVDGTYSHFKPHELLGITLSEVKRMTEQRVGCPMERVVVICPIAFGHAQRKALMEAVAYAGLIVERLVSATTAAAVELYLKNPTQRTAVIVDVGAGKMDVAVVSMCKEQVNVNVLSVAGSAQFGTEDFVSRLVDHCASKFTSEHESDALRQSKAAMQELRYQCQRAMTMLSEFERTDILCVWEGATSRLTLTRAKFEELVADMVLVLQNALCTAVRDANVADSITELVLLGGGANIPLVRKTVIETLRRLLQQEEEPEQREEEEKAEAVQPQAKKDAAPKQSPEKKGESTSTEGDKAQGGKEALEQTTTVAAQALAKKEEASHSLAHSDEPPAGTAAVLPTKKLDKKEEPASSEGVMDPPPPPLVAAAAAELPVQTPVVFPAAAGADAADPSLIKLINCPVDTVMLGAAKFACSLSPQRPRTGAESLQASAVTSPATSKPTSPTPSADRDAAATPIATPATTPDTGTAVMLRRSRSDMMAGAGAAATPTTSPARSSATSPEGGTKRSSLVMATHRKSYLPSSVKQDEPQITKVTLCVREVAPYGVCVETATGTRVQVISRNVPLPVIVRKELTTRQGVPPCTCMQIRLFAAEGTCGLIATSEEIDVPLLQGGPHEVTVLFEVDENGTITLHRVAKKTAIIPFEQARGGKASGGKRKKTDMRRSLMATASSGSSSPRTVGGDAACAADDAMEVTMEPDPPAMMVMGWDAASAASGNVSPEMRAE